MFELIICMKVPSDVSNSIYEEKHKYYAEYMEDLFSLIELTRKLSKFEISYEFRELEEGQIYEK